MAEDITQIPSAEEEQSRLARALERQSELDLLARESQFRRADDGTVPQPEILQPSEPLTFAEINQAEAAVKRKQEAVSFTDAVGAAVDEDWVSSWVYMGKKEYEPDPNLQFSEEDYSRLTEGLPEEYHDYLEDAVSMPHAEMLRERALQTYDNEQKLASLGWGGVGIRLGVAIADPVGIGVSIATEGIAAPAIWGNKLTRLGRAVRGATGAAATNAAIEAYLVSQNSVKDPYDVLYAASAGFLLGGGIGAIAGGKTDELFDGAMANLARHANDAQAQEMSQAINNRVVSNNADEASRSVGAAENPDSRSVQIPDVR